MMVENTIALTQLREKDLMDLQDTVFTIPASPIRVRFTEEVPQKYRLLNKNRRKMKNLRKKLFCLLMRYWVLLKCQL